MSALLLGASAALVVVGLAVEAVTGSETAGYVLLCLSILLLVAALFTLEPPDYMGQVDYGSVPLRLWD